jgi:uncharacterized protein
LRTAQARRIWLRAQRLDQDAPFGDGPEATRRAVEHLGYVQIDTIHVVERCHHQILYTRIPAYRRADLHRAQTIDKTIFEYWTHALSYVPTRDLRFFVRAMKRQWGSWSAWFGTVTVGDTRKVLARIRRNGPLTIRDIDDDVLVEKDHEWSSRKPSKRALQLLFYRGVLTVSARSGMLKTYELLTRHFGLERLPQAASERETLEYLLERALRSQGVISLKSVGPMVASRKVGMRRLIEARVRRGELIKVEVEGAPHWVSPDLLELPLQANDAVHILSPFDPLVIQRGRLQSLFGYEHRFEAYVPKEKRVLGYFTHPVLVGDKIVAVLDLKTDRVRRKLLLQKWTWVTREARRQRKRQIEEALHRFERFQLD